jgi:hypothetical protein
MTKGIVKKRRCPIVKNDEENTYAWNKGTWNNHAKNKFRLRGHRSGYRPSSLRRGGRLCCWCKWTGEDLTGKHRRPGKHEGSDAAQLEECKNSGVPVNDLFRPVTLEEESLH